MKEYRSIYESATEYFSVAYDKEGKGTPLPKIDKIEIEKLPRFSSKIEARYYAKFGRNIWSDIVCVIEVVDASSFEEGREHNGGGYVFWDQYCLIPEVGWVVVHYTSSDFAYCPRCGSFSDNCICDDYDVITTAELNKVLSAAQEEEDYRINIL